MFITRRAQNTTLPLEILRLCMRYAVTPAIFVDSSLSAGPLDSAWCRDIRTKKSLALVCKNWWPAAMQLLYEHVALRRLGQLPAFVETMDSSSFDVEASVRTIDVSCVVPEHCSYVFQDDINLVLRRCRRVHTFIYRPTWMHIAFDPFSIRNGPGHVLSHLTHLDVSRIDAFPYHYLFSHLGLSSFKSLQSLAFHTKVSSAWRSFDLDLVEGTPPSVTLPELRSLRIVCPEDLSGDAMEHVSTRWSMPQLRNVTLDMYAMGPSEVAPAEWRRGIAQIAAFLKAHGRRISFLHIHSATLQSMNTFDRDCDVTEMVKSCPALVHLVVHPQIALPLEHQTIEWVDIQWQCLLADDPELGENLTTRHLPSLRGVRVIDRALANFPWLALELAPGRMDAQEFWYGDLRIRCGPGFVYKTDMLPFDVKPDPFLPDTLYRPSAFDKDASDCGDDGESVVISDEGSDPFEGVWHAEDNDEQSSNETSDSPSAFEDSDIDIDPNDGEAEGQSNPEHEERMDRARLLQIFRESL